MNPGDRYVNIISNLVVPQGDNGLQPINLPTWQAEFLRTVFGKLKPDGTRQIRKALLFVPKRNAKTTLAAGIAVASLFLSKQHAGQLVSVANSVDQASLAFDYAATMIRADPFLKSKTKILDSKKTIIHLDTKTTYRAISSEDNDKNGRGVELCIYDEIAETKNRGVYDKIKSGMGSVKEPLMLALTTAGDVGTVGHELYLHACACRDNPGLDPTMHSVIYEATPDDDWRDVEVWKRCNPNYGISLQPSFVEATIAEAISSPSSLNTLLRYHLNYWVNAEKKWIVPERWQACNESYPLAKLDGMPCWIGGDLAATVDVAALVLIFPLDDGRLVTVPRFYIPKDTAVERERLEHVPWLAWERQGYVTLTPGNVIDYDYIRNDIHELAKRYQIRKIALDPWNATQLAIQLGGDGLPVEFVRQGFTSLSSPTKEFEKLIISRRIIHNSNPIASWMVSNCVVEQDATGNIKPDKSKSSDRIDYVFATVTALATWMAATPADRGETQTNVEQLLTWL